MASEDPIMIPLLVQTPDMFSALSQTQACIRSRESVSLHAIFPVKIKCLDTHSGSGLGMLHGADGFSQIPCLETRQEGIAVCLDSLCTAEGLLKL